jgi:hypothetical protein
MKINNYLKTIMVIICNEICVIVMWKWHHNMVMKSSNNNVSNNNNNM